MSEMLKDTEGTHVHADVCGYTVFTASDFTVMAHWSGLQEWRPGRVYVDNGGEHAPDGWSPAQARELAAALLRAADEAENAEPKQHITWGDLRGGDIITGHPDRRTVVSVERKPEGYFAVSWTSPAADHGWTTEQHGSVPVTIVARETEGER